MSGTAFKPERFTNPVVSPNTASLFRRTPYISPSEYKQASTAVGTGSLVPGGSEKEQLAELAAVIMRASDWVDTICFHKAEGTLAASPTTESGWVPYKAGGVALICNFKPILEIDAVAFGPSPNNMMSLSQEAAEAITIGDSIIYVPGGNSGWGPVPWFPAVPTNNGKVWAVWEYVNGFPHTALAKEANAGDNELSVTPSIPGELTVYGVYPGTQLEIHDGENTETVVVESVVEASEGENPEVTLNLTAKLQYDHEVPEAPDSVRVSAIPWLIEQACISLTSSLIKKRGTRAMVIPSAPTSGSPPKQVEGQAGGTRDEQTAKEMLKPFIVPYVRST